MDAQDSYDDMNWAIEAKEEHGRVKYSFRRPLPGDRPGPGIIRLKDWDDIPFRNGPEGERLNGGPLPELCNLRHAVCRVLRMSGAAEVILQLKDDADDSEFPHVYFASTDFANILSAKLLPNSGRVIYG